MCIAILSPEGKIIPKATLEQCYRANKDGAGYMYAEDGKLHIHKGFFSFNEFYDSYQPHEGKKCVLHFRIKTHGLINKDNCHPYSISEDMAFVHNGMISIPQDNRDFSDTWHFNEKIIKPMYKDNRAFIKRIYNRELIKNFIGYSKLIFMDRKGRSSIINSDKGVWDGGVWYSNTSYQVKQTVYPINKPKVQAVSTPLYSAPPRFTEGEYVQFARDYRAFAKDEYVYVEDVLPLNQVKVISHTFQNGQTVEISAIIPTYVLREADYVESSFTRYL